MINSFTVLSKSLATFLLQFQGQERNILDSVENATRSGRPRKVSNRDTSFMIREVNSDPSISSQDLANLLSERKKTTIAPSTIRTILLKNNLRCYSAKHKPFLTRKMKKRRLDWCMAHKDLTHEFWSKVLFSDETCIAINLSTIWTK